MFDSPLPTQLASTSSLLLRVSLYCGVSIVSVVTLKLLLISSRPSLFSDEVSP